MRLGRAIPAFFCAVLLAAHFLRSGRLLLVLASLAVGLLAFSGSRWATRAAQAGLILGTAEWVRTLAVLVDERRRTGLPFARLTAILAAVTALTAVSPFLLRPDRRS